MDSLLCKLWVGRMSIFKIDEKFRELMQRAEENDGDITEFFHEFEENETDFNNKLENYWNMIKTWQAENDAISKEYERLDKIITRNKKNIERLKENIKNTLELREMTKYKTNLGVFSIRTSKSVHVPDINNLSEEYIRIKTTKEENKELIKKAIKAGVEVKGAEIITNKNLIVG